MNRTDRLLALVLEIRRRGSCRAEDLAATFGTSKRTIYRDVQALCEAGVPVVALNGVGYQLAEGYFLPPLAFTAEEATLILLGLGAVEPSFDREYQGVVADARRKIAGALSDTTRARGEALARTLHLANLQPATPAETERLRLLRRAILEQRTVSFRYFTRHPDRVTRRDVDPHSLACLNSNWFVSGHCHLRNDRRFFRLSRMEDLALTERHFEPPPPYDPQHDPDREQRGVTVRVVIDDEAGPWIAEDRSYYITAREPHPDGTLVTLQCRTADEVLQWVLSWGRLATVLEPPDLRQRVADEARGVLARLELGTE